MKYIVVKVVRYGKPDAYRALLFSKEFSHDCIYRGARESIYTDEHHAEFSAVGAGFVTFTDGLADCFGESATLEIKSRGNADTQVVRHFLATGFEYVIN